MPQTRRAFLAASGAALTGCAPVSRWLPPNPDAATKSRSQAACSPSDGLPRGEILCGGTPATWPAQYKYHAQLAVSDDGRVAAAHLGRVYIWNAEGEVISSPGAHDGMGGLAFAGEWLAAARCSGIDLLDSRCQQSPIELRPAEGGPQGLAGGPDGRVYAGLGDSLNVWDAASGSLQRTRALVKPRVWAANQTGLLVSFNNTVAVLDPQTLATLWQCSTQFAASMALAPDGAAAFTAGAMAETVIAHGEQWRILDEFPASDGSQPAFSPDGDSLALIDENDLIWVGRLDSKPRILEESTGGQDRPLRLASLAFSPDGTRVYGLGLTGIGTWDVSTSKYLGRFEEPS